MPELGSIDESLAAELWAAAYDNGSQRWLGFGTFREYPRGVRGEGDIDSGPIVLGAGVSATGFALAGAVSGGDVDVLRGLLRTTNLFGVPTGGERKRFLTGGAIGNALLFAMLQGEAT